MRFEINAKLGPHAIGDFEAGAHLPGKDADEAKAEGGGLVEIEAIREADAIIGDHEEEVALGGPGEADGDLADGPSGKGVLEAIGDELVGDEADGDGGVEIELNWIDMELGLHAGLIGAVSGEDHVQQAA